MVASCLDAERDGRLGEKCEEREREKVVRFRKSRRIYRRGRGNWKWGSQNWHWSNNNNECSVDEGPW